MPQRQDLINCSIVFAYCIFFASLRLILPHSLSNDEAEQIFAANDYVWGYTKQAPLYSWILKTVSFFTELNLISLTIIKYFFYFIFMLSFYYTNRLWFKSAQALIATSFLLYFVTYSYDFNRDLTHTILLTTLAVLSYQQYFYLLERPKFIHYLLLGLFFGLGLITKYNFVFIALAIVLTALSNKLGRERIFSSKTIFSIALALLISLPHFIWLLGDRAEAFGYALNRADIEKDFSFFASIKSLFFAYYEIAIVLAIFLVLWSALLKRHNTKNSIKINLIQVSFYGLLLPALTILTLGLNSFFAKWLSPVMFSIVPALLINIDFGKSKSFKYRSIFHYALVAIFLVAVTAISLLGAFAPDLVGRIRSSQYPYEAIKEKLLGELKTKNIDTNQLTIITTQDHLLLGNMQYIFKKSNYHVQVIKLKDYQNSKAKKILIWNYSKNPMPKAFYKYFPQAKIQKPISALYINSQKNSYKLGWAIAD